MPGQTPDRLAPQPHASYVLQVDTQHAPQSMHYRPAPEVSWENLLHTIIWASLCPCIPAAQVASTVGNSYWGVFFLSLVCYAGGIACYGVGMTMPDPVLDWEYDFVPFLVGWILYVLGPWSTVIFGGFVAFAVLVIAPALDERGSSEPYEYGIGTIAIMLVVLHALAQIPQVYYAVRIRKQLQRRAKIKPLLFLSICCPSCSLAHTAVCVKSLSKASDCCMAPLDELPGYA